MDQLRKKGRRVDEPLVRRVFNRRGTVEILMALDDGQRLRFTELGQELPNISQQVIGSRLAELREIGMLDRVVQQGPPITTTYSLTEIGTELAGLATGLERLARSDRLPAVAA